MQQTVVGFLLQWEVIVTFPKIVPNIPPIVVIIITSIKLISTSTEEEAAKSKNGLMMGVIGLLVIQMADVAVKKVFFGESGQCFTDGGTYLEECLTGEEGGINFFRGILGFECWLQNSKNIY